MPRLGKSYEITIECIAQKGKDMFCVGKEMNLLFKVDLDLMQIETISDGPEEDRLTERLFNGIDIEDNKLILVPYNAKKFWIYDLDKKEWTGVEISTYADPRMQAKFVGGVLKNGRAFLFGYKYHGILVVDLDTCEVRNLFGNAVDDEYSFWGQSTAIVDNRLYIACRLKNEVIGIDLNECTYEEMQIEGCSDAVGFINDGMAYDGRFFFIMPHHGNYFYIWQIGQKVKKIEIDDFYDSNENFFNGIAVSDHIVYLFSPKGKTYIYDRNNPSGSYIFNERIYFAKNCEGVGMVVCPKGKIQIFDTSLNLKKEIKTAVREEIHSEYIGKVKYDNRILNENGIVGISELITMLPDD